MEQLALHALLPAPAYLRSNATATTHDLSLGFRNECNADSRDPLLLPRVLDA
jgi:hypothetical protein